MAFTQGGKIQQTGINILDLDTGFKDLMQYFVQAIKILNQFAEHWIAAIPSRPLYGGPGFGLVCEDVIANGLDLIHQRTDRVQGFIGF